MDRDRGEAVGSSAAAPEVEHDRLVKALTAERFRPVPRSRQHVPTTTGVPRNADDQRRAG